MLLFTGHSEHVVDGKLRLAIPAKYRNQWDAQRDGSAWYCVPWPSPRGHLRIYTEARFRQLSELSGENTLLPGEEEALVESDYYALAERLEPDSTGRIALPRQHVQLTTLGAAVVIIGARTRLEVHDKDTWLATLHQRFTALPELVRRVEEKQRAAHQGP